LKCHAFQGYKVGDIRGGISITFPAAVYINTKNRQLLNLFIAHLLILTAGIFGIYRYFKASSNFFAIIEQKNLRLETDGLLLRQSNQDLHDSLERNRATVSAMPDILFSLNYDGYFTSCQAGDNNFLLFKKEEIIGKSINDLLPPVIAKKGRVAILKAIETNKVQIFEYKLDLPLGLKWFEIRIVNSSHNEILAISRDITERKNAEVEIRFKNKQLKDTIEDKDRFMSILAHDLRSPFSSIIGFLNLLTQNIHIYDIPTIEKKLLIINNSANKAYNLFEDILIWARTQSGKIPFNPCSLELVSIVNDVFEILMPASTTKRISLEQIETNELWVYADADMLKTILRNLISNAIKFTPTGGRIEIRTEHKNSFITISVSDNGIGLPREIMSKLFDPSNIYTTPGTEKESGTGLGLLICKEFAEKHGGQLWIESEEGKGSTFSISIPDQPSASS
jgi:signal transduction histidine kinase